MFGLDSLIPAGISIFSSLFGGGDQPEYHAPDPSQFGMTPAQIQALLGPQYQSQDQSAWNVDQSPLYAFLQQQQGRMAQGGQALPPEYRQAVLGQAQREMGQQQGRDQEQAYAQANQHGLLGSGSLGVRQGMIGEQYSRAYANIIDQLTQQELGERGRLQSALAGMEGQRMGGSQWNVGQNRQGQQFAASLAMERARTALGAQQGAYSGAQQNAMNQYNAGQNRWMANASTTGAVGQNLANLFGAQRSGGFGTGGGYGSYGGVGDGYQLPTPSAASYFGFGGRY